MQSAGCVAGWTEGRLDEWGSSGTVQRYTLLLFNSPPRKGLHVRHSHNPNLGSVCACVHLNTQTWSWHTHTHSHTYCISTNCWHSKFCVMLDLLMLCMHKFRSECNNMKGLCVFIGRQRCHACHFSFTLSFFFLMTFETVFCSPKGWGWSLSQQQGSIIMCRWEREFTFLRLNLPSMAFTALRYTRKQAWRCYVLSWTDKATLLLHLTLVHSRCTYCTNAANACVSTYEAHWSFFRIDKIWFDLFPSSDMSVMICSMQSVNTVQPIMLCKHI